MKESKITALKTRKPARTLRVGFLADTDCAPMVVAQELGLFHKHGCAVELYKAPTWKHACDHLLQGRLDAAQVPAMIPLLVNLGLLPEKRECVSGMVLSLQGSTIVLSCELGRLGVNNGRSMREQMWRDRHKKIYLFGVPFPLSTQEALLRKWLNEVDTPPNIQIRIEQVPPTQMYPMLKLGYLDGFCAPEPWGSVAMHAGVGVCVATSATLAPLHPETVLMVTSDFARKRAGEHERLMAALLESCAFCDEPENRADLSRLLAHPHYVNAPRDCLEPALVGPLAPEAGKIQSLHGLHVFHRCRANEPGMAKASWLSGRLFDHFRWSKRPAGLARVFRPDLFRGAERRATLKSGVAREGFRKNNVLPFAAF